MPGFDDYPLPAFLQNNLRAAAIEDPTAVQREVIPGALAGRDMVVEAPTGTGKTLAYLLPVMAKIDPLQSTMQALLVAPTRELSMQIFREVERMAAGSGLRSIAILGGTDIKRQIEKLKEKAHIAVGSPGRMLDLIQRRKMTAHHVRVIVVDEADHMMESGFREEVELLARSALRDRQLMFVSATMPPSAMEPAERLMRDPLRIHIEPQPTGPALVDHMYILCSQRDKSDVCRRLLRMEISQRTIVFVNTAAQVKQVGGVLLHMGFSCGVLHGEEPKEVRKYNLQQFRDGRYTVLVTTGLAARGIDIPDVDLVVNYELPPDANHYIHRTGRTGRAGRHGIAVTLVSPREQFVLNKYQKELRMPITQKELYGGKIIDPSQRRIR